MCKKALVVVGLLCLPCATQAQSVISVPQTKTYTTETPKGTITHQVTRNNPNSVTVTSTLNPKPAYQPMGR